MARRYALVKLISEKKLTDQQFHETLDYTIKRYFGEVGFSRIDPRIMEFDSDSWTAIVSCERSAVPELAAALSLITKHAEVPFVILVLRVSGTIKNIRKRLK